jgi:hypothetical protein
MPLTWIDIEPRASTMFNIWNSGGDLDFAKEAWGHLISAGLAGESGPADETRSLLRLLVLRKICGEFSCVKWEEGTGDEWCEVDIELDPVALGVLAGEYLKGEAFAYSEERELKSAAIVAVTDALLPEVVRCLLKAYGGTQGLYARLCGIAGNGEGTGEDEDEDDPTDYEAIGNNLVAFEYVDNYCRR